MKRMTTPILSGGLPLHTLTKTLVTQSSLKQKTFLLILLFFVAMAPHALRAQCTMVCHNMVNISLSPDCHTEIAYNMVLHENGTFCSPNNPSSFSVTLMNSWGGILPGSPFVDASNIGDYITVKVNHLPSGNSCWGNIFVNDELPPQISCPPDLTISCTGSTAPAQTGTPDVSDCSSFTVSHTDAIQSLGCTGDFAGIITRAWMAVDLFSNSKSCTQIIRIAKPTAVDIQWPSNRDGISAPAIDCVNPDTTPEATGFPAIDGHPIPNGNTYCSMSVTYGDQVLPMCENSYKILRTWTTASWCSGAIQHQIQIIAVKDDKAPALTCPDELTVSTTSAQSCTASLLLPPVLILDDCSSSFSTIIDTPAGQVSGNGGAIYNVYPGTYTIQYHVTDNCGNTGNCSMTLAVVDNTAPTVVCDLHTTVTLTNYGQALVYAQTFDDGSYDNCGSVALTARRMTSACGTQPEFGSTVKFCCEDVGNNISVQMKATDLSGNSNTCMVTVHVDDNSFPSILCPSARTIACTQDPNDLNLTGQATASVSCGTPIVSFTDVNNINMCLVGNIVRTWKATLSNGHSSSCTQTITVGDNTPVSITFPPDYTAQACTSIEELSPGNLPSPYSAPVMSSDCELLASSYTDQVFVVAAPACFKIVRTWKVISWCDYQPGGNGGTWQSAQIITVMDNTPPSFTCPQSFTVGVGQNCKASVTLPQVTDIEDCSENISVTVSGDLGNGFGPFQNVAPGSYSATYLVSDGCNNTSACTIHVLVKDEKRPTPYCKNGLVIELMGVDTDGDGQIDGGTATIHASDFNAGSFDNCGGALQFSFSASPGDVSASFDCDDQGQNAVRMWVTDASGNQDYCETFLIVQDNMGVCSGSPLVAGIGGAVTNEEGDNVESVMVSINDSITPPAMTGADGNFTFPAIPLGGDYSLSAKKDNDLLNGVTSFDMVLIQRHVLNIDTLGSPYKIIAADVNRSNSVTTQDLVFLRKAILLINSEFPNNESWRFVDANYVFPNPYDPFQETFPEYFNINNFNGGMQDFDFIAIKIGDVNGTAIPNQLVQPPENRSGESLVFQLTDQELEPGEMYLLDFTAQNFKEIASYQFTLKFDPEVLEFFEFEPVKSSALERPVRADNFGFHLTDQGLITTSWNDFRPGNLSPDAALFRLQFQAHKKGRLSEILRIASGFTKAEAYKSAADNSMELLDVQLVFKSGTGHKTNYEQMTATVSPNPFGETTVIGFQLTEAQEVTLNVFDPAGRLVKTLQGSFGKGRGEFKLEAGDLSAPGMYFYRLQTKNAATGGQLVKF